jgi:hypothetical protein
MDRNIRPQELFQQLTVVGLILCVSVCVWKHNARDRFPPPPIFWLPLKRGASMKLSVSLQFLNLGQSAGLLGRVISSSQEGTASHLRNYFEH